MPINLRLKDQEQEAIENASLSINKLLIDKGIQPVNTSGIAHMIIDAGLRIAKENPDLILESSNKDYRKLGRMLRDGLIIYLTVPLSLAYAYTKVVLSSPPLAPPSNPTANNAFSAALAIR